MNHITTATRCDSITSENMRRSLPTYSDLGKWKSCHEDNVEA